MNIALGRRRCQNPAVENGREWGISHRYRIRSVFNGACLSRESLADPGRRGHYYETCICGRAMGAMDGELIRRLRETRDEGAFDELMGTNAESRGRRVGQALTGNPQDAASPAAFGAGEASLVS